MTEPAKDDARNPSLPEWVINEKEQPAGSEAADSGQPDAADDEPADDTGTESD
jgi:hypothetical protein